MDDECLVDMSEVGSSFIFTLDDFGRGNDEDLLESVSSFLTHIVLVGFGNDEDLLEGVSFFWHM